MSKHRNKDRGDVIEIRRAMLDLQKQLNDRVEAVKLLQVENRRCHQHIKGLESKLLQSTCTATPGSTVNDLSAASTQPALPDSWYSNRTAKTGGSLRCSTAGDASALRVFKQAAAKARTEAEKASTALSSTQQQLQEADQQLKQAAIEHQQLREQFTALQQHTFSSDASNTALQGQLQRFQQVLHVKQQDILHMQQQLQQLTAQQQVQQESSRAAHQQEMQQLQEMHTTEFDKLRVSFELKGKADSAAAQDALNLAQQQLSRTEQAMQHLCLLRQGYPTDWTCCTVRHLMPIGTRIGGSSSGKDTDGQQSLHDAYACDLHLQVLLHSMNSQPGLLGISKQDWCPLLLVHIVRNDTAADASRSDGQLVAAVTTRPWLVTPAITTAIYPTASSDSASGHCAAAADEQLQQLLQLQLPREIDAAAVRWMSNGQLQLSLINAASVLVGAFKAGVGRSSSSSEIVTQGKQQHVVIAVLLPLGVSCKCWTMGLFETTADNKPGCYLGLLSAYSELSQIDINRHSTSCSSVGGSSGKVDGLPPWSYDGDWVLPELEPGEFLVPGVAGTVSGDIEATPDNTASATACPVETPCPLHVAALKSGLFTKTTRTAELQYRATGPSKSLGQGCECAHKVTCQIWTVHSADARAAVSKTICNKNLPVASQPWQGANTILAAATVPVGPATAAVDFMTLATAAQWQVLDSYKTSSQESSTAGQGVGLALQKCLQGDTAQVDLMHNRGKSVAQVQMSLRYDRPVQALLDRFEQAQQQKAAYDQHFAEIASKKEQIQRECRQEEALVQQQQVQLEQKDQQLQVLQDTVTRLEANYAAEQQRISQELAAVKQMSAASVDQHEAAALRCQKQIEALSAENEQLQHMLEQQLQQLDDLEEQLKTSKPQQAAQSVQQNLVPGH